MAAFPTSVSGTVTRLYPGTDRLYFNVSGDQCPGGGNKKDYNFIFNTAPHFQATYQLLLKAAEHKWRVVVRRSNSMDKHQRVNENQVYYNIEYVYVDL